MKLLFCPDPVGWLPELMKEEPRLVAPWALSRKLPTAFLGRRYAPGCKGWPGWPLVEGLICLWAGSDTGRRFRSRFWLRTRLGGAVSRLAGAEQVMAPSLAAQELFARTQGKRVLILDQPLFRELHADLDSASARHPRSRFLNRFRAPAPVVARQEAELALADEVVVFGDYVAEVLRARGICCRRFPHSAHVQPLRQKGELLLAGLATARNGAFEALSVLEARPDLRLRLVAGEGAEKELVEHPRTMISRSLDGVSAVLAPAWVESYPSEVRQAARLGIPVIATRRAAGFVKAEFVERGDVEALVRAVQCLESRV